MDKSVSVGDVICVHYAVTHYWKVLKIIANGYLVIHQNKRGNAFPRTRPIHWNDNQIQYIKKGVVIKSPKGARYWIQGCV